MKSNNKNKHLTLEDRNFIQDCLHCGMCFKDIANRLGKDPSTISKEIKAHITTSNHSIKKDSLGNPMVCPRLNKPPYVCNGCSKFGVNCGYQKSKYYASYAHESYKKTLSSSRECVVLNKQSFYEDDAIILDCINKGQHIYHITKTNNLHMSLSSIYRYLNKGYLSASKIDLPRAVKFSKRKLNNDTYIPKKLKINRTYEDFTNFVNSHKLTNWVEMDTVIGVKGGKVILTFNFTFCNLIFGFLLNNKTSAEVTNKVKLLKSTLSEAGYSFGELFPVILTDNGGEFSNVNVFENDLCGNKETDLFFCDPYKSCQKPHVENSHTQLRNILPKGSSFNNLTQKELNLIFSHINNAKKRSLNGKSAYEVFCFMYSKELAHLLGITYITPTDVIQNKLLLKK